MQVLAVNIERRLVLMDDDSFVPITNLLDAHGDECDIDDALAAVAGPDGDGQWHSVDLTKFSPQPIQ